MPESELTSGNIRFVQNYRPALQAGAYKVVTTQKVEGADKINENNVFYTEKEFFIRGERFNLKPLVIDSVFPPDMSRGDFEDTLPHIVFNNLTLPWERSLLMQKDESDFDTTKLVSDNGDSSAWMALLLFDEDDPAPIPKKMKLRDLYKSKLPAGVWFPPAFEIEYGESMEDECTVIDVPKDLFLSICPSIEDLKLLAHGRIVNVDHKTKEKKQQLSGNYSVIIGSRIPRKGKESMVHLVSLEGFAAILNETKKDKEKSPHDLLDQYHYVRLVSFRKWRFSCLDRPESFKKLISHLNDADKSRSEPDISKINRLDNLLRFPLDYTKNTDKEMGSLLQSGYVPLNHQMRQGYKTVSLYRGPFVPMPIEQYVKPSYKNQDQLYFRDPDTNFLDVSYATAWQLGQLLGLRNLEFSQAIYKWKQDARLEDIRNWEKEQIKTKLKVNSDEVGVLMRFDETVFSPKNSPIDTPRPNIKSKNPFQRQQPPEIPFTPPENPPDVVNTFLEELQQLHHVPFHYLVPGPTMLPMESLKFFYVDPNWRMALTAGAKSIGDFLKKPSENNIELTAGEFDEETMTGFLLRSAVLTGWPGMEILIKTIGAEDNTKEYVRLERMSPDSALVIVKGIIEIVTFREPGEGLHFGININEEGKEHKKAWRDDKAEFKLGESNIKIKAKNVIDIIDLAEKIPLKKEHENTTADFAFQMVEGVDVVQYTLQNNQIS